MRDNVKTYHAGMPLKKVRYNVHFEYVKMPKGEKDPWKEDGWEGKDCRFGYRFEVRELTAWLFDCNDETRCFVHMKVSDLKINTSLNQDDTVELVGEVWLCPNYVKVKVILTPVAVDGESIELWWPGKEEGKLAPEIEAHD